MAQDGKPNEVRQTESNYTVELKLTGLATYRKANQRGYFDAPEKSFSAEETIKLSAISLESLKKRLHAHIDLIEFEFDTSRLDK